MSAFESSAVQNALAVIDREGADLSKSDWIDLCEAVASYFDVSADAARDELKAEEGEGG